MATMMRLKIMTITTKMLMMKMKIGTAYDEDNVGDDNL